MPFKITRQIIIANVMILSVYLIFSSSASAQRIDLESQYWKSLKAGEQAQQVTMREFRVVTDIEDFEDRFNATVSFPVASEPPGAIATLHDIQTGEPLQNCMTPCSLNIDGVREYMVMFYAFGHQPIPLAIHKDDLEYAPNVQSMGINFLQNFIEWQKCYQAFLAQQPKVDAEVTPCYRAPPLVPAEAETSGHCVVTYDVNQKGQAENIAAVSCSDELFRERSEWTVSWWSFNPKVERGEAVTKVGLKTNVTFRLLDELGEVIPEP